MEKVATFIKTFQRNILTVVLMSSLLHIYILLNAITAARYKLIKVTFIIFYCECVRFLRWSIEKSENYTLDICISLKY